jgi:Holliday junction resolvase RusA-like endonuclease
MQNNSIIPETLTIEQYRKLQKSCSTSKKGRLIVSGEKILPEFQEKVINPILASQKILEPINPSNTGLYIVLNIEPHTKPRMTSSDRYKKRKCTTKYWEFKAKLKELVKEKGWIPSNTLKLTFIISMPKSWSRKKRIYMDGKPHQQTPDTDNLTKSFKDSLYEQDCTVWAEDCKKLWGNEGQIIIQEYN